MKLLKNSITNFRGISALVIDAQGKNINIYGENGAGKTTVEDSFLWLMFGKDSADRKDYDLKPHDLDGNPITGEQLEPTVIGTLEHEGKTITLKKIYAEQWPKRDGIKVYDGSKVRYFINELEVKAGEYQAAVSSLISEDVFKLITNPRYFSESLSWQNRRETLVKIAGGLYVQMNAELESLSAGRSFEEFYALKKQQAKEFSKKIDAMPSVINEARRNIPQVEGDAKKIWRETGDLKVRKIQLETELSNLKSDTAMNQKRRDISNTETEIIQARATYVKAIEAENAKIKSGISQLESELNNKNHILNDCKYAIGQITGILGTLSYVRKDLQTDKKGWENKVWDGETVCPTCNRDLPEDQVETAKSAFNTRRSNALELIHTKGDKINSDYIENQKLIDEQKAGTAALNVEITALTVRIESSTSMRITPDFENTDECKVLQDRLDALHERIKGAAASNKQEKIDALQVDINALQEGIEEKDKLITWLKLKAEREKRVVELMEQEKALNVELEQYQKAVKLCENYVKAKAKALEIAVNGKFKIVKFQLFEMQKNGEESECCNVLYPNGSTGLSRGEKAHAGLDIINTLSEFYGVSAPIFFDDAEGITKDLETTAQLICLKAVKGVKNLKVEVKE